MRLLSIFFILFVTFTFHSRAQKEDRNWVFGRGCGIDFNDLTAPVTFVPVIYSQEASASISDKNGNLLFYVSIDDDIWGQDVFKILNSNHALITNGDSIKINSSAINGAMIVPAVDDPGRYYLFQIGGNWFSGCPFQICYNLYYSVIQDINGEFTVTEKNIQLIPDYVGERLAAVKHANGKDWWILAHEYGESGSICSNKFYRFLLTASGLEITGDQNLGTFHCSEFSFAGEMVFSQDGSRLAVVIGFQNTVDLFDFDRCTGLLNNYIKLDGNGVSPYPFGCEFSKTGRFLYVSGASSLTYALGDVYQYNLSSANIESTGIKIWTGTDSLVMFGQLQLGPDDKIYISRIALLSNIQLQQRHLGVISNPDSLGSLCNLQELGFYLGDSVGPTDGLPNMPNYNLGPMDGYQIKAAEEDTLTICSDIASSVILGSPAIPHILYSWTPSRGLNDTTVAQPIATPTKDLWYYLTITDTTGLACTFKVDSVFLELIESCTAGIKSDKEESCVVIYPNPAISTLNISLLGSHPTIHFTTITDFSGKEILRSAETSIPISSLLAGLYFVKVQLENGENIVKKLIVR